MSNLANPDATRADFPTLVAVAARGDHWTRAAIERHQAAEAAKASPANWAYYYQDRLREVSLLVCIAGIYTDAGLCFTSALEFVHHSPWALGLTWGTGILLFIEILAVISVHSITLRSPAEWRTAVLIEHLLPEWVQDRMAKLRALCPHVQFTLFELWQDYKRLDPILMAHWDGQEAVLAVWDENGNHVGPPAT